MRISRQMLGLAVAGMVGMAAQAQAQVFFSGYTLGCFNPGTTAADMCPNNGSTFVVNDAGLQYATGLFSFTTFAGEGGVGNGFGAGSNGNFGLFADNATATDHTYAGNTFTLEFVFTAPAGADSPSISAAIPVPGVVSAGATQGSVNINFINTPTVYHFAGGAFTVHVNNLTLGAGQQSAPITGYVDLVASPEPASIALFATGLLGLIPVARRRKQNQNV